MKTFFLEIIPRIQRFSKSLDNLAILTNKHWVLIDEELNSKVVFIFREKENQLLISENGKLEKGNWEYLGNNSLMIESKDGSYLFKHGFIDDKILALKVDGKEEYALLINEQVYDYHLNSFASINKFLDTNYLKSIEFKNVINTPSQTERVIFKKAVHQKVEPRESFLSDDYPQLTEDLEIIRKILLNVSRVSLSEIIISFSRDHSIDLKLTKENPELINMIVNYELPISFIEQLFSVNRENKRFIKDLESFIEMKLR